MGTGPTLPKPYYLTIFVDLLTSFKCCHWLTSIAGLVHVNDLNLTTQILVSPCHTCPVYAIKEFGFPCKIYRHLWIFLPVLKSRGGRKS